MEILVLNIIPIFYCMHSLTSSNNNNQEGLDRLTKGYTVSTDPY